MMQLVDGAVESVRRAATALRPGVLDDLGLPAAVEWLAQDFEARSRLRCTVSVAGQWRDVERNVATALFRIVQEALTNVVRHAQARTVSIGLVDDAGGLRLEVRDDGRGITESERLGSWSMGLLGMRERARLVGGELEVRGTAGRGTVVAVRVPPGVGRTW
jgi:signal transduction histidine kinase